MSAFPRLLRPLALAALALTLSGCFQVRTLVRLQADGSGVIEERVFMSGLMKAMLQMPDAMLVFGFAPAVEFGDTEESLRDRADSYGATFESMETVDMLFGEGYVATYAFEDVRDLRLAPDPLDFIPEDLLDDVALRPAGPIAFSLDGDRFEATIPRRVFDEEMMDGEPWDERYDSPRDPKKAPLDDEWSEFETGGMDEATRLGVEMILRDLRFSLAVELPRGVAQTNASFVEGQTLTLYDFDLDGLADDPEQLTDLDRWFTDLAVEDESDLFEVLRRVPGVTYEPAETVTVTFQ